MNLQNFESILITGCSGFIGSFLGEVFSEIGKNSNSKSPDVFGLTRKVTNLSNLTDKSRIILLSEFLSNPNSYRDFDLIIHTASPASPKNFTHPELLFANVELLENLINRQARLKQFIFLSAGEVYGKNSKEHVSEDSVNLDFKDLNRSIYPESKIMGENKLLELASKKNFMPKIIRLFHTYGPGIRGNDGRSISDFFWNVALGGKPKLYSSGEAQRTFLYATDFAAALLSILSSSGKSPYFNVGSSDLRSIKDFATLISRIGGNSEPLIEYLSSNSFESSPINRLKPDLSRLHALGWKEYFSLDEGVRLTLNWLNKSLKHEIGASN